MTSSPEEMLNITINDMPKITDYETFHDVFAEIFGFPGFHGRNLDAWIDCRSLLWNAPLL